MSKLTLPTNVIMLDKSRFLLQCTVCWQRFSPNLRSGGKLSRNGKQCPNRCSCR